MLAQFKKSSFFEEELLGFFSFGIVISTMPRADACPPTGFVGSTRHKRKSHPVGTLGNEYKLRELFHDLFSVVQKKI